MRYCIFLIPLLVGLSTRIYPQHRKEDKAAALQNAVDLKAYVFRAQTVLPASGRARQLTSPYTFTVRKDSVISDLPYFGRAYSAPLDPSHSPLQFSSEKFVYSVNTRKKGGWEISIQFKDTPGVQSVLLSISRDGYGTLQVIPVNLQIISFTGFIDEK